MTATAKAYTQPGRGDVHVNRPLTNISVAFMQNATNFVADRVFPNIPVSKQSDAYFTYDRGEFNRDTMEERLPATESAGGTYKVGTETYYARVYAYHKDVPDQVRDNSDAPLNLDREATEFVALKGLLKREISWVNSYFKPNIWSNMLNGGSSASTTIDPTDTSNDDVVYWSNAQSDPIENVRLMKRTMLQSTGFMPNVLTLGRPVFDVLVDHPDIIGRMDRGQTSGPAMANRDALAALFEVDEVLIMDAIQNTAKEGLTAAHSFIGGKHALLTYRPPSAGLMTPSAGYTFSWTGFQGATNLGNRIKRFRMEAIESDRVENQIAFDHKVIAADLGGFFNDIVQ